MASRSMARGCGSTVMGLGAVLCAYMGSGSGASIIDQSWSWGYAIPWIIAFMVFSSWARSMAKDKTRSRQDSENASALDDNLPFMLMLRPFSVDKKLSVKNPDKTRFLLAPSNYYEEEMIPVTQLLAQAVQPDLHLKVIGGEPIGPGVVKADDSEWREKVLSSMRVARGIVMVALPGKEIPWELQQLRLHGWLQKSIFLLPPMTNAGRLDLKESDRPCVDDLWFFQQLKADGFDLPNRGSSPIVFRIMESGGVVEKQALDKLDYSTLRWVLKKYNLIPPNEGGGQ